jgi:hypothetical protein
MAEKTAKERAGRRAWRQWSNRREYKRRRQARKHQVEYTPLMGWNKQRKANNEGIRPPEKLAKPLTASSLPGMTMGARRRAARADCYDIRTLVHDFRNHLRIGERLRPCPGCEECRGYDDGIGVIHCDGSGVLPAKSKRRKAHG